MKAQHNYTTTVTTRAWYWRGAAALAALLALAAVIFGLMGRLRPSEPAPRATAASDSVARHAADPIIPCRLCRDEWLAARAVQPAVAVPAGSAIRRPQAVVMPTVSHTSGPIIACRVCRDEWIASQAPLIPSTGGTSFDQPEDHASTSGPR